MFDIMSQSTAASYSSVSNNEVRVKTLKFEAYLINRHCWELVQQKRSNQNAATKRPNMHKNN